MHLQTVKLKKKKDVYKRQPQLSLDMLMRLQSKTPEDNRISKELADVYYTMGQYGKAKEAYENLSLIHI